MRSSAPSAEPGSQTPLVFNRRVSIRYPSGLGTSTSMAAEGMSVFRKVRVLNISQGGIGLILRYPPEPGTMLYIRINNRLLSFTYDLAANVLHVTPQRKGLWLVGCAFTRELTLSELAGLV